MKTAGGYIRADELIIESQVLNFPNKYWINEPGARFAFESVVTQSEKMMKIFDVISSVLEFDTSVLINGETGTGKELLARAIHFNGPRREKPFIAVNCASIPDELFESELFGFKRGAFTGANEDRKGLFQSANGGTILLDEIGDMPLRLQAKLLRVIQDKKVTSLGSDKSVNIDVRIIAATNKDLESLMESGNFREDLFYRLNVVPITLPPLRERKEDIPALTEFFLRKCSERFNAPAKPISPQALDALVGYSWPGNIRELENLIEKTFILNKTEIITNVEIPLKREKKNTVDCAQSFKDAKSEAVEDFEKTYISSLLELNGGKIRQAARQAGMDVKNFFEKMKKYGIRGDMFL